MLSWIQIQKKWENIEDVQRKIIDEKKKENNCTKELTVLSGREEGASFWSYDQRNHHIWPDKRSNKNLQEMVKWIQKASGQVLL